MTTVAEVNYLTRQLYGKYKEKELYHEAPLSMYARKTFDFKGQDKEVPADAILAGGVASSAATAALQHTSMAGKKFKVPSCPIVGHVKYETIVLQNSTGGDKFVDYVKKCLLDTLQKMNQEVELLGFGDGTGARAQVISQSAATITVAPWQSQFFSTGQLIGASSSTPGSALVGGTPVGSDPAGSARVLSVNTTTGVITVNGTAATQMTGLAAGFNLYHWGIASNNGTGKSVMTGLAGWNPATVTASAFMGIDRTLNINALGGTRYDCAGLNPATALIRSRAQAKTDLPNLWKDGGAVFMHPLQFAWVEEFCESLKMIDDVSDYEMGIRRIKFRGNTFTEARSCALNLGYQVGPDGAEIAMADKAPYTQDAWDNPQDDYCYQKLTNQGNWFFTPPRLQRLYNLGA